jgi:uncharacterized protein involved in exopolysaccharide biosynthesis
MRQPAKTLAYYAEVLFRRQILIWVVVSGALLAAIGCSLVLPKTYQANTVFFIPSTTHATPANQQSFVTEGVPRTLMVPIFSRQTPELYLGLLRSEELATAVMHAFPTHIPSIRQLRLKTSFRVTSEGLMELRVRDADPQVAADIANAYVQHFHTFLGEFSLRATRDTLQTLEKELKGNQARLQEALEAQHTLIKDNNIVNYDQQLRNYVDIKRELQLKLYVLQHDLRRIEEENRALQEQLAQENQYYKSGDLIMSNEQVQEMEEKINTLHEQLAVLTLARMPTDNERKQVQARLDTVISQMAVLKQRLMESATKVPGSFYDTLRRQLALSEVNKRALLVGQESLEGLLRDTEESMRHIFNLQAQYLFLQQRINLYTTLVEGALRKIDEAKFEAQRQLQTVVVVDQARSPEIPFFPNLTLNIIVALFASLLGGIWLVFLLEYIEDKRQQQLVDHEDQTYDLDALYAQVLSRLEMMHSNHEGH